MILLFVYYEPNITVNLASFHSKFPKAWHTPKMYNPFTNPPYYEYANLLINTVHKWNENGLKTTDCPIICVCWPHDWQLNISHKGFKIAVSHVRWSDSQPFRIPPPRPRPLAPRRWLSAATWHAKDECAVKTPGIWTWCNRTMNL